MPGQHDDDRPKKSWRDIDRQRDQSRHLGGEKPKEPLGKKQAGQSAAYRQYKSSLERLFSGAGASPLKVRGGPGPSVEVQPSPRRTLLGAIRTAGTRAELIAAVGAYLKETDQFPEEQDVLVSVLRHPDEALVRKALAGLLKLAAAGQLRGRAVLEQKIKMAEVSAREPETQELAAAVRGKL